MNRNSSLKALDELFNEVGTYRKSHQFRELLEFIRRFPGMSPYNAMLIHMQKPGCRYVLTPAKWWEKFGCRIRPYARPLVILRPFGPVSFVFDIEDTEGGDIPYDVLKPFPVNGVISPEFFCNLRNNLQREGVEYHEADYGLEYAGCIERRDDLKPLALEHFRVPQFFRMMANRNLNAEERFATIAHEMGHMLCGHLGSPVPGWLPERWGESKNVREFEAESVAWLVCKRAGIDSLSSAGYLFGYLDAYDEIPPISLEAVLRAVNILEDMYRNQNYKVNKKLVDAEERRRGKIR